MPYFINNECIGCTICAKKCPVPCIWGGEGPGKWAKTKELHIIEPGACIECGVCASYCPVDCIQNEKGVIEPKIEAKKRPVALVREENCTGCEWCVDVCPFDCIEMVRPENPSEFFAVAKVVRTKDCVACKLCEEVCVQKDAVVIVYPDGSYADDIGVTCRTTYMGPDNMAGAERVERP
jgi:formate hydrogenlyase subunit 6/NADH:ubiquinone oxidoreductase subunit I